MGGGTSVSAPRSGEGFSSEVLNNHRRGCCSAAVEAIGAQREADTRAIAGRLDRNKLALAAYKAELLGKWEDLSRLVGIGKRAGEHSCVFS